MRKLRRKKKEILDNVRITVNLPITTDSKSTRKIHLKIRKKFFLTLLFFNAKKKKNSYINSFCILEESSVFNFFIYTSSLSKAFLSISFFCRASKSTRSLPLTSFS